MRVPIAPLAALAMLLAACGSETAVDDGRVTIQVNTTPAVYAAMFEAFEAAFEARNPDIDIVLDTSIVGHADAVQAVLRGAIIGRLPDVAFLGHNYVRTLADRRLTVPLDAFIAGDRDWTADRYAPSIIDSARVGGAVHGVSVAISFPILYYNRDLVAQELGAGAAFPADWPDIVALSRRIDRPRDGVLGGYHRAHQWFFQAHVESRGARLMNEAETAIAFDGPEGLAALEVVEAFARAGQARVLMNREQSRQAFLSGTIGVLTDSSAALIRHKEQIGDRFVLGTAPLPVLSDDAVVPALGVTAVLLSDDEDKQRAAWRFVKFVAGPEGQLIVARYSGYVPANLAVVDSHPPLRDLIAQRPLMAPALSALPRVTSAYAFPGANAARIDKVIFDHVQQVAMLQTSPAAALSSMAEKVTALLGQAAE